MVTDTKSSLTTCCRKPETSRSGKGAFSCETAMSQQHCLHLPPQGLAQDYIYQGSQLLDAVPSQLFSSTASKIHRSPQTSTTTKKRVQHKLTLKTLISSFLPQHCRHCSLGAPQQTADLQDRSIQSRTARASACADIHSSKY